jgi:hypothetical protein
MIFLRWLLFFSLEILDDFIAEDDILDDLVDEATLILKASLNELQEVALEYVRRSGPRKYVKRSREEYHRRLMDDYFSDNLLYSSTTFRRRFRMTRPLFLRIVDELGQWSPYFTARIDAVNRPGLSPLQKCTSDIRQLAYGSAADQLDEYLKIGDSTALVSMKFFGMRSLALQVLIMISMFLISRPFLLKN